MFSLLQENVGNVEVDFITTSGIWRNRQSLEEIINEELTTTTELFFDKLQRGGLLHIATSHILSGIYPRSQLGIWRTRSSTLDFMNSSDSVFRNSVKKLVPTRLKRVIVLLDLKTGVIAMCCLRHHRTRWKHPRSEL
ncbi:hypothetical protein Tco_0316072 [Tanacetum coccineum]